MNQPPERSWWSRHWKWVVPVGCLTPLLVCGGGVTLLVVFVFGALKSSDVYREAVDRAKASAAVQDLLGTPIQEGFWVSGSINVSGPSGNADLSIPLSGPKGSATLHAVASKSAGRWEFSTLEVVAKGSDARIDLLPRPDQ